MNNCRYTDTQTDAQTNAQTTAMDALVDKMDLEAHDEEVQIVSFALFLFVSDEIFNCARYELYKFSLSNSVITNSNKA